jgi:hypothetical protein
MLACVTRATASASLQRGRIGGQFGLEDLEGDAALERELFGEVDLPHAADTEAAQDVVIVEGTAAQIE